MKDVRNSHNRNGRWGQAFAGRHADTCKQIKYLTWYRWGFDHKHLDMDVFGKAFEKEFDRVKEVNHKTYGCLDPWIRKGVGYVLRP